MDNHVKDFLNSVELTNKGESEFLQAVEEVAEAVMYLVTANGEGIVYEMRLWRFKR